MAVANGEEANVVSGKQSISHLTFGPSASVSTASILFPQQSASSACRAQVVVVGVPQVIIRDPCKPSHDGTFPINEAKLAEQHRWKFVEWFVCFRPIRIFPSKNCILKISRLAENKFLQGDSVNDNSYCKLC